MASKRKLSRHGLDEVQARVDADNARGYSGETPEDRATVADVAGPDAEELDELPADTDDGEPSTDSEAPVEGEELEAPDGGGLEPDAAEAPAE